MSKTPPSTWHWGRLNDFHAPGQKAVGSRLPAHEEIFVDGMSDDDAAYMRREFDDPNGPVKVRILRLTPEERTAYGLPDFPVGEVLSLMR